MMISYKDHLINGIMRISGINFTADELKKKTIKQLELIFSFYEKYQKAV